MKRKINIILGAATASMLSLTALSQDASNAKADDASAALARMAPERVELLKSTAKVRDVIGLRVENPEHAKLGRVQDFALDLKSGRIVEVILSAGGGRLAAVPPGALHPNLDSGILELNVSQEKFNAAPRFDAAKWADETQSNRVSDVYNYFGEQPYFIAVPVGDETTNENGSVNALGTRTLEHVRERELARQADNPNNTISIQNPDGNTTRDYYSDQHAAIGARSELGYDQSAGKLLGMPLRNEQGVKLGKVANIIVDLKAGRVAAIIIKSGGYFGAAGQLHAVPPTELRFNADQDTLLVDVAKVEFSHSPHFNVSQWPNYKLPGYAAGTYYPYKIEPFNNNTAPNGQ
jgi:sporulation protein YlmC with PRC-barrel domain